MALGKPIATGQNVLTFEQVEEFCGEFLPKSTAHCYELVTGIMTAKSVANILRLTKAVSEISGRDPIEIIHKLSEYS